MTVGSRDPPPAQAEGLAPDMAAYTALLHVHRRAGHWEGALRLWREMAGAGVAPSHTYPASHFPPQPGSDWTLVALVSPLRPGAHG